MGCGRVAGERPRTVEGAALHRAGYAGAGGPAVAHSQAPETRAPTDGHAAGSCGGAGTARPARSRPHRADAALPVLAAAAAAAAAAAWEFCRGTGSEAAVGRRRSLRSPPQSRPQTAATGGEACTGWPARARGGGRIGRGQRRRRGSG